MAVDASDLILQLEAEAIRIRNDAADDVLSSCKDDCPVSEPTPTNFQSGRLRDSLQILETSDTFPVTSVSIGSDLFYAAFTDEIDTSSHPIVATNVPLLRFWWDHPTLGPGIYRYPQVQHPGTRGQHWFESKNQERWDKALEDAV